MLTRRKLQELLNYDPSTGVFMWKVSTGNKVKVGGVAGYSAPDGYIQVGVERKIYKAHRLAWFYVYGYFPEHGLDHKDRDPSNNRIKNLREVSQQCNMRNTGNCSTNTSGVKGVSFDKDAQEWRVDIRLNGKNHYVCQSADFIESVAHRLAAEQCGNWSDCDSLSPAFRYMQEYLKGDLS